MNTNPIVINGKVYAQVSEYREADSTTVVVDGEQYTLVTDAEIVAGPVATRSNLPPFSMIIDFNVFDVEATDGNWYQVKVAW
jgi:hypothetical protein